jgi:hypothetical protein
MSHSVGRYHVTRVLFSRCVLTISCLLEMFWRVQIREKRRWTPKKKRTKSVSVWQNRHLQGSCSLQAKAAQFPVRHVRLTLKIPTRTRDPPLTAGDWQLRPFSPSRTQGTKLFQSQIKIKVIFFKKSDFNNLWIFSKSVFTGITHLGPVLFCWM